MSPDYPPEVTSKICEVLRWIDANPKGKWKDMGPLFGVYKRWRDILRGDPPLLDDKGTQHTVPGLSSFGRLFLCNALALSPETSASPTAQSKKGFDDQIGFARNNLKGMEQCTVLREAPADQIDSFPLPAAGRFVFALEPPVVDDSAELLGDERILPGYEQLALVWQNRNGQEVLCPTDGFILMHRAGDATWLPEGWEMDVYPAGWKLPHLERWFEYALEMARLEGRGDIPKDTDLGPFYAPAPRGLVMHAHLIVRHLGLPGSPTEPRGQMSQAGCLAELRDVRGFFRRALQPQVHLVDGTGPRQPAESVGEGIDIREIPLEAPARTPSPLREAFEAVAEALHHAWMARHCEPLAGPGFSDAARQLSAAYRAGLEKYRSAEVWLLSALDQAGSCAHNDALAAVCRINDACGHVMLRIVPSSEAAEHVRATPGIPLAALLTAMRQQVSRAAVSIMSKAATDKRDGREAVGYEPRNDEPSSSTPTTRAARQAELTAVERAMQILMRDPNQSNRAIARQVGCDPSLLSKDEKFKRLRAAYQGRLPKGEKSKEGDIESELDE